MSSLMVMLTAVGNTGLRPVQRTVDLVTTLLASVASPLEDRKKRFV
jgi:hypothetical protein